MGGACRTIASESQNVDKTEGLATAQKAYEISKSLDFEWDFVISELISRDMLSIKMLGYRIRIYNRQLTTKKIGELAFKG